MTPALKRRSLLTASVAASTLSMAGACRAAAQGVPPIRIGVLTALSGPYMGHGDDSFLCRVPDYAERA